MINKNAPFGLKPISTLVASEYSAKLHKYAVSSTNTQDIWINDAVKLTGLSNSDGIPYIEKANAGDKIVGIVQQVFDKLDKIEYIYCPAITEVSVSLNDDPFVIIEIQVNGTLTVNDIGKMADIIVVDGDAVVGMSHTQLNLSTLTTSVAQIKILNVIQTEENDIGLYTKVSGMIAEHEFKDLPFIGEDIFKREGITIKPENAGDNFDMGDGWLSGKAGILHGQTIVPTTTNGAFYYNSTDKKFYFREDSKWNDFKDNLTGLISWTGTGAYISCIYGGSEWLLDVLRGGSGYINGKKIPFTTVSGLNLSRHVTSYLFVNASGVLSLVESSVVTDNTYQDNICLFGFFEYFDADAITPKTYQFKADYPYSLDTKCQLWQENYIKPILSGTLTTARVASGTGASDDDRKIKITIGDTLYFRGLTSTVSVVNPCVFAQMYYSATPLWDRYKNQAELLPLYTSAGVVTVATNGKYLLFPQYISPDGYDNPTPIIWSVIQSRQYDSAEQVYNAIRDKTYDEPSVAFAAVPKAEFQYVIMLQNAAGGYIYDIIPALGCLKSEYISDIRALSELNYKLSTKTAISTISFASDFYLSDTASGIGSYYYAYPDPTGGIESSISQSISADNTLIAAFITASGDDFTDITRGIQNLHIYAEKTAGTKDILLYWELYSRTTAGVETLLNTSELSLPLTSTKTPYDLNLTLSENKIKTDSDMIVVKIYGNLDSGGSTPTATIYMEGTSSSRVDVQSTVGNVRNIAQNIKLNTASTSRNAALTDNYRVVEYANGANAYTYTIPASTTTDFPLGCWIELRKTGAGEITIAKGAGVTFRGVLGDVGVKIDGTDGYSVLIEKTAVDTWILSGALKAI